MGDLETLIAKEGPPNAVQQYAQRTSLGWLSPEGFERHRVAYRVNCGFLLKSSNDATFSRFLMVVFLILTCLVLIQILILEEVFHASLRSSFDPVEPPLMDYIFAQTWLYGRFQIEQTGIIFVAILASLLTVGVFAKKMKKKTYSGWPRRDEVQTICAHVQQV